MDGQFTDLMAEMGGRARAAAAELACASSERKSAALISAAAAVWDRREEILDANCLDMDEGRQGPERCDADRLKLDDGPLRGIVDGCAPLPNSAIRWAACWPNGTGRTGCTSSAWQRRSA
jgi:glutamate-5-semialdehyde dehydrogenase